MKVEDLFTLHQGNNLELMHIGESKGTGINFVSRSAQHNGVVAEVEHQEYIQPFPAGDITIALGGSVLSSFVQLKPFYTAFHIMVLKPKQEMLLAEKLYYCMSIQANAYRYNYGRQANKTLKDIELPDTIPQWVYSLSVSPYTTATIGSALPLSDPAQWGEFALGQLFSIEKGKRLTKEAMSDGSTNYIGAISENNGIRQLINMPSIFSPNCITVNYNGSVGEAFYQSEPFCATDDVNVLYAKGWTLNKYIALFIATVIKANRYQFSYGRKWTKEKMEKSLIKLPITPKGLPDFAYMEQYIQALPYSDRI